MVSNLLLVPCVEGCGGPESWTCRTWIQNCGRPGPLQKTAGSEHALWGRKPPQIAVIFTNTPTSYPSRLSHNYELRYMNVKCLLSNQVNVLCPDHHYTPIIAVCEPKLNIVYLVISVSSWLSSLLSPLVVTQWYTDPLWRQPVTTLLEWENLFSWSDLVFPLQCCCNFSSVQYPVSWQVPVTRTLLSIPSLRELILFT